MFFITRWNITAFNDTTEYFSITNLWAWLKVKDELIEFMMTWCKLIVLIKVWQKWQEFFTSQDSKLFLIDSDTRNERKLNSNVDWRERLDWKTRQEEGREALTKGNFHSRWLICLFTFRFIAFGFEAKWFMIPSLRLKSNKNLNFRVECTA